MSGNVTGGKKAALANKERYGEDFYARIGSKGGKNSHTGGFGGRKSKRGPAKKKKEVEDVEA